jgi:hypothetical protein
MIYSYSNFKDHVIDPLSYPNAASSVTVLNVLNRAARLVVKDIDLQSAKRKAAAVQLFDDEYEYTAPTDLKNEAIIDFISQKPRSLDSRLSLVTPERFDRKKSLLGNLITVVHQDGSRRVRFSGDVEDTSLSFGLNSLTEDGTWSGFGDGTNVTTDNENYVEGSGSINWDINAAGGTTAGVQNTSLTAFDISDYTANGVIFLRVYITSITNITNFKVRVGMDTSANYYELTTTTQADGTAFVQGWNVLKLSFSGVTETGTVTEASCDSLALYMTKAGAKVSETDYRFDKVVFHTGDYHNLYYYSKYPWQTNAGTWIENSTTSTDLLNADTDEFDLFVMKGKVEMFRELKEYDQMKLAQEDYEKMKLTYQLQNPSQRLMRAEWY